MNPNEKDKKYIAKVAEILGETTNRVTWDLPRLEIIYRLVDYIEEGQASDEKSHSRE